MGIRLCLVLGLMSRVVSDVQQTLPSGTVQLKSLEEIESFIPDSEEYDATLDASDASEDVHHHSDEDMDYSEGGFPQDCAEIFKQGISDDGVYTIQPAASPQPFEAFCDMHTDGGGWTVFQRRHGGAVDFNRTWAEYRRGFGAPSGEHWLGNQRLHELTAGGAGAHLSPRGAQRTARRSSGGRAGNAGDGGYAGGAGDGDRNDAAGNDGHDNTRGNVSRAAGGTTTAGGTSLRVDLEDWHGVRRHALYARFRVAPERERYRLTARGYRGDAGNALTYRRGYSHDGRRFSTPDRDHDAYAAGSCAAYYSAGWWFDSCFAANLNGRYYRGGRYRAPITDGIFWGTWYILSDFRSGHKYTFKLVEMKTRPADF